MVPSCERVQVSPCTLTEVGGVAASQRTARWAWRVAALGRPGAQSPALLTLIPACAASVSLDDLHGASVSSGGRRLILAGHLLVRKGSRWVVVVAGGGTTRRPQPSHGGCRPALEQLTSAKAIGRGRCASRRFCASGELSPAVEVVTARSQSLDALIPATIFSRGTWGVFWRLPALPWCTQSPEDPANLLHNGEQVGADPWCNVASSDSPTAFKLNVNPEVKMDPRSPLGRLWKVFFFSLSLFLSSRSNAANWE